MNTTNPLLDFSGLPRFDAIRAEHVTPAIDTLLAQAEAAVKAAETVAPVSWENFVVPLDDATERLYRAWGADVIGIDWRINIADAIARIGDCAIQGNLDPFALLLPKDKLRARVAKLLQDAAMAKGHIFNLGHGINQFTPPQQAKVMIDTVHELSQR